MIKLATDPKNRTELVQWLERRKEILIVEGLPEDTPLTPREYLMIETLRKRRAAYSIT